MIGVLCHADDEPVVREFFELFKTPWEFHRAGRFYPVILSAGVEVPSELSCRLLLIYDARETAFDRDAGLQVRTESETRLLAFDSCALPVYRGFALFPQHAHAPLADLGGVESGGEERRVIRLGCQLFREVRHLLTDGQPADYAGFPTVDLHIQLLRRLIVDRGIPLIEIPPVPEGHPFIVCLSHDIDQPSIRLHRWDHTMWGFLARAGMGPFLDILRGRMAIRRWLQNGWALLKLPLIWLGWTRDIWRTFDRYLQIEKGLGATYFVIPFKNRPCQDPNGQVRPKRASPYEPADIAPELRTLAASGQEVGVHGLNAWKDADAGRNELAALSTFLSGTEKGVRMHWLYFDDRSFGVLEESGYTYDATVGYCETVGYRAGTSQAYRPLGAGNLLELPLQIMDTALFFPSYLNLTDRDAQDRLQAFTDRSHDSGGTITINWHDRSIAPERLWGDVYCEMIDRWKRMDVWFATHGQAVAWFRHRRSASFTVSAESESQWRVRVAAPVLEDLPPLQLRVHRRNSLMNGPELTNVSRQCGVHENMTLRRNAEVILNLPSKKPAQLTR